MGCPSVGVRTVSTIRDSRGLNVEWERANRPKKPNRAKRHCSLHLMPQALHIKCPFVGVRTMSTAVDSGGGQRRGM